jgi:excisionase family DNA binding protein
MPSALLVTTAPLSAVLAELPRSEQKSNPILTGLSTNDTQMNVSLKLYTTREVARRAGVSRQTLQAWIARKKVKAPAVIRAAGVRLWTEDDLAQVVKVKPRNYPRRGKPKKRL